MIRSILSFLGALTCICAFAGQGCNATGVGDPCTPEQEYDKAFLGFAETEASVESRSFQCQTRACLVNHFRGRVSCPNGQDAQGTPPTGDAPCTIPGTPTKVDGINADGSQTDPKKLATVCSQCTDRIAANAVYCSCRCANIDGQTNDGSTYCTCPDGFTCTQLIPSITTGDVGLTGAYCIKANTAKATNSCTTTLNPTDAALCAPP